MTRWSVVTVLCIFIVLACDKKNYNDGNGIIELKPSPYTSPVWHPNGQLLGFNYTPLKSTDSSGFWLIDANGTNKRRVLNFKVNTPCWSPDGNWLAYSDGSNIFKIFFNGETFDTSQKIQLTTSGKNFFPSWDAQGNSITFDSWDGNQSSGYKIWKMGSDGTNKMLLASGRMPTWKEYIFFVGRDNSGIGIMKINSNNLSEVVKVVSQPPGTHNINNIRIWNGLLFYQLGGTGIYKGVIGSANFSPVNYDPVDEIGFDISAQGKIAFVLYSGRVDAIQGTLWLMNYDGSNKKQLTFNNL